MAFTFSLSKVIYLLRFLIFCALVTGCDPIVSLKRTYEDTISEKNFSRGRFKTILLFENTELQTKEHYVSEILRYLADFDLDNPHSLQFADVYGFNKSISIVITDAPSTNGTKEGFYLSYSEPDGNKPSIKNLLDQKSSSSDAWKSVRSERFETWHTDAGYIISPIGLKHQTLFFLPREYYDIQDVIYVPSEHNELGYSHFYQKFKGAELAGDYFEIFLSSDPKDASSYSGYILALAYLAPGGALYTSPSNERSLSIYPLSEHSEGFGLLFKGPDAFFNDHGSEIIDKTLQKMDLLNYSNSIIEAMNNSIINRNKVYLFEGNYAFELEVIRGGSSRFAESDADYDTATTEVRLEVCPRAQKWQRLAFNQDIC